jgi:hypothetical protein
MRLKAFKEGILARHAFIQKGTKITVRELSPGEYKVFAPGDDWNSQENRFTRGQLHFEFGKNLRFEETELSDRVEFSEDSITLYPVQRGTVKRLEISGEAFDAK